MIASPCSVGDLGPRVLAGCPHNVPVRYAKPALAAARIQTFHMQSASPRGFNLAFILLKPRHRGKGDHGYRWIRDLHGQIGASLLTRRQFAECN